MAMERLIITYATVLQVHIAPITRYTGFPSYMTEEISVLEGKSNVVFLDGDGTIDNYIRYRVTGAHSPYHQVYWISFLYDGRNFCFGRQKQRSFFRWRWND